MTTRKVVGQLHNLPHGFALSTVWSPGRYLTFSLVRPKAMHELPMGVFHWTDEEYGARVDICCADSVRDQIRSVVDRYRKALGG